MTNPTSSRRGFLSTTVAGSALSASRVLGANDRVRIGVIGTGGRGSHLINMAKKAGGCEFVAISDAWDKRRDEAETLIGAPVEKFADYRKVLDRKDIDGVIVATLDHLHSRMTVDACKAGKDVYVEKPMTSLPMQGHDIVNAVRQYKRIVQVGVQQRSLAHFAEAKTKFFDSGLMGKVHMVRTVWNANTGYLTVPPPGMEQKPAGLDWDACPRLAPQTSLGSQALFQSFRLLGFRNGRPDGWSLRAHGRCCALVPGREQAEKRGCVGRHLPIR